MSKTKETMAQDYMVKTIGDKDLTTPAQNTLTDFLAGFDACEKQLLEQAASGFDEFAIKHPDQYFAQPNTAKRDLMLWQASALHSVKLLAEKDKEVEATKKSLIEMTNSYENCFGKFLNKDTELSKAKELIKEMRKDMRWLVNIVDYGIRSTRLDSRYSKNTDKIKALLGEE